jgi:hypothetical protein
MYRHILQSAVFSTLGLEQEVSIPDAVAEISFYIDGSLRFCLDSYLALLERTTRSGHANIALHVERAVIADWCDLLDREETRAILPRLSFLPAVSLPPQAWPSQM